MKATIRFLNFFLLSFIILLASNTYSQEKEDIINKIDSAIISYRTFDALQMIYEQEKVAIDSSHLLKLKIFELKALEQTGEYDKVIDLSNFILKEFNPDSHQKLEIYLIRALVYEILGDLEKTRENLDISKEFIQFHFNKHTTPFALVALYYIRESSYYRILHAYIRNEISYNKYIEYANKAYTYSKANNFTHTEATANMLLGFNKDFSKKERIEYSIDALEGWKKLNDIHGISGMYNNLSYLTNSNFKTALTYNDSSLLVLKNSRLYINLANSYERRYLLFKRIQPDSALLYYIKYRSYLDSVDIKKKLIDIYIINREEVLRSKKFKNKKLKNDILTEKKNNSRLIFVTSLILALLFGLSYLYYKLSNKKKEISLSQKKLAKTVEEKTLLLTELNHRVKNNMALILSLVQLQGSNEKNTKADWHQLEKRIQTMAMANNLYSYTNQNLKGEKINLKNYISVIISAYEGTSDNEIKFNINVPSIKTKVENALPIAIIFNELITNSIKHAKPIIRNLEISISIILEGETFLLKYDDNGTNFEDNVKESTGIFILNTLTKQLKGTIERKKSMYLITLLKK